MSLDSSILSLVLRNPLTLNDLRRAGVTEDFFVDDYQKVWSWVVRMKSQHSRVPSLETAQARFGDLEFTGARKRDLPILLNDLQKRKRYMDFLDALDTASRTATEPDEIEPVMASLQRDLNELAMRNGKAAIVDLFSAETSERLLADIKRRRSGLHQGLPTGLKRFDATTGGLQKGRMAVVMGRPGIGKSWMNLLFVASSVMYGAKVVLYPLEMTLEETALRLYTIFSQRMYGGGDKVLRNLDLSRGRISKAKIVRLMNALEDRFEGQLGVADIGNMSDPYTIERIEAEIELHKPDMFWVDYITLMKAPGVGRDGAEDHTTVKALSNGIKQIAVRHGTVGGASAQVNREAIKTRAFLPRIEHIAYGDAIGQDADGVISINKKGPHLYYAMVKNRHGPEIGRTRCKFFADEGVLEETTDQDDEEDEA